MPKENKPVPLFEVLRDKEGLMCTYEINCIYDKTTLDNMSKAGHKFKLNGKSATAAQIMQYIKEHKSDKKKSPVT